MFMCWSLALLALGAGSGLEGSHSSTSATPQAAQAEAGWIELLPRATLDLWRAPRGAWQMVESVAIRPDNHRLLTASGTGGLVLYNGPAGRTSNLLSRDSYGDLALHAEFFIPERSNSGIKFHGLYEIQIADLPSSREPSASGSGGIYHRAELAPRYHHIDEGYPPRINAARPPGEWQTLDVVFRAPRFDNEGRKLANARFESVVLNGQTIHENREIPFPTGHAWRLQEMAEGPLLIQGDHGPVAFRAVRVRPLPAAEAQARTGSASELNRAFTDPALDPASFVKRFENNEREVYTQRNAIVELVQAQPGQAIADVGAGTGLYSRLFASKVGKSGVVYAIDISRPMLNYVAQEAHKAGLPQIYTIQSTADSILLPAGSLDTAFLCDTYHHFEHPGAVLKSMHDALRPNGRLVLVEFDRRDGSSKFVQEHIRADQATFVREIEAAGFERIEPAAQPQLKENFVAVFRKRSETPNRSGGGGSTQ